MTSLTSTKIASADNRNSHHTALHFTAFQHVQHIGAVLKQAFTLFRYSGVIFAQAEGRPTNQR